jgi:hypothetical protein
MLFTICIHEDHANGHEERVPVEFQLGVGRPGKATSVPRGPDTDQDNDHGTKSLCQPKEQTETLEVPRVSSCRRSVHYSSSYSWYADVTACHLLFLVSALIHLKNTQIQ